MYEISHLVINGYQGVQDTRECRIPGGAGYQGVQDVLIRGCPNLLSTLGSGTIQPQESFKI
jgi:hypothetical protein